MTTVISERSQYHEITFDSHDEWDRPTGLYGHHFVCSKDVVLTNRISTVIEVDARFFCAEKGHFLETALADKRTTR